MADYQKMYAILCGAVDDALMGLEQGSSAASIALRLRLALERAEEIYLETSMCAERCGDTNLSCGAMLRMSGSNRKNREQAFACS